MKEKSEQIMRVSVHDLSMHICYTYTISSLPPYTFMYSERQPDNFVQV